MDAIKRSIGDLDMRPLGLDAVGLNNFLERMFNNLNQVPIFSKITTSTHHIFSCFPAVRHVSPNDLTGRTLTKVLLDDTALTLIDRNDLAVGMIDQVMGQILTLMYRHQNAPDLDINEAPRVGDFCFFRHSEKSKLQSINTLRLGLIVGISNKGLDGLSRSLFIQARTRQEGDADDPQAKAGRIFTFHRKPSDIVLIESSREKAMHDLFRADILRQHQAFASSTADEDTRDTPDEPIKAWEDPVGDTEPNIATTMPPMTSEIPTENKKQDQPEVRRSARISAKVSQACIMLLAMTPGQTPNARGK